MNIKVFIKNIAPSLYFHRIKREIDENFYSISDPVAYFERLYKKKYKIDFNIREPKTFYEKLSYLKFFYEEKHPEQLIDKVLVKDLLRKKGYGDAVAPLIASFYTFEEFHEFFRSKKMPNECVVKLNHTSGDVFFYHNGGWRDKHGDPVKKRFVLACLKQKLRLNYYHVNFEKVYSQVKPQIFIESYIPTPHDQGLAEYKFFCNWGKIILINVVYGRQEGKMVKEAFTDEKLTKYPVIQDNLPLEQGEIYVPKCFEAMKKFAEEFSKDHPLIRVDLYDRGEAFSFAEFTFYDCAGFNIFTPLEYNEKFGDLISLEK